MSDETRLTEQEETRLGARNARPPSSLSGWLSSSDSIDHGRFPPGTLLGGRYRIVGRLGRGRATAGITHTLVLAGMAVLAAWLSRQRATGG